MKTFRVKTLVAALAVVGFASACDDRAERNAYVPPEPAAVEESTLAEDRRAVDGRVIQGTTASPNTIGGINSSDYGNASDRAGSSLKDQSVGSLAEVDHQETVEFDGRALTDDSEEKLQNLVESLDKDKPVEIIVAMEEGAIQSDPSATPGTALRDTADPSQRTQSGAEFSQQVDELRQFMQEQGVQVVQWRFEGSSQDPAAIEQPGLTQDQQAQMQQEDLQQVRLVVSSVGSDGNGISGLGPDD